MQLKATSAGAVAQSVEQRTENPCVAGSIPAHTTTLFGGFFCALDIYCEP